MKPARFDYDDPADLDAVLAHLASAGDEAKVLAGGQSLVPLMNFRLARPAMLIDINRVESLAYLADASGGLAIGALTRQADLERSRLAAERFPVLVEAVRYVGHAQIRNRGTVGGSVAHADPAAELPCALTALEARFLVASVGGRRELAADALFQDLFTTAIRPEELLVEIRLPQLPPATGHAFVEFARRHGDFALGGACALLSLGKDGRCERARLALLGAGPRPVRAIAAEGLLEGGALTAGDLTSAAKVAVEGVTPVGDIHGSSEYRVGLLQVMAQRALEKAARRAWELTV